MKTILIIMAFLLALILGVWQQQSGRVKQAIAASVGDAILDSKELAAKAATNEVIWRQASAALLKGDYPEAARLSSRAYAFQYEFLAQPDCEIKPGLKVSGWFEAQKNAYASNVVIAFDQVVSNAVAVPERSHMLMDYYAWYHHEVPELDKLYEYRKFEVSAARVMAADKWFRVTFTPGDAEAVQPLKSAIEKAWNGKYGRTLVWGNTIDDAERDATWMILNINLGFQGASYEVQGLKKELISIQVPEKLSVSYQIQRQEKMVTSWDDLPGLRLSENVPATIVASQNRMYERISEVAAEYQKKLLAQLAEKIKTWPKFVLFPGRDPNQTSLLNNGAVDHEAALVLACLAPDKLLKEATAATATILSPQREELVKVAIDHSLTPLAAWVTGVINDESEGVRNSIWQSLKRKPYYGSFVPLLAMVSRAAGEDDKVEFLKACKGYLFDPKVLAAITGLVNQPTLTRRGELAKLLLTECPPNLLASYLWLSADKEAGVAETATEIIAQRDPKLRWQMMAEYLDQWSPERKSAMLFNLHYNPREHGPEVLALFGQAAGRGQDERVRELALKILMYETAEIPAGWQILEEVGKTETDPKVSAKIKEALARAINKAHPEMAGAYLLKTVMEGTPEQRATAANGYFRSAGDVDAKLKAIVPVLPKYMDEPRFIEALLRGFSDQGASDLKDFSAPELQTLITLALSGQEPMVRYYGITLSNRAWSKGQPQYEKILAKYMLTETNTWLTDQAKTYYAPMVGKPK